VGEIRVVCNGDLDPFDVKVAKAARDGQEALARTLVSSWQSTEDGLDLLLARERYRRLHDLLASGRMKVRVVPRDTNYKARASRGQNGRDAPKPNNLLRFLRTVSSEATNEFFGTATPIQLDAVELWDLLVGLWQGTPHVLGTPFDGGNGRATIRYAS
jgi:hypothetical protein